MQRLPQFLIVEHVRLGAWCVVFSLVACSTGGSTGSSGPGSGGSDSSDPTTPGRDDDIESHVPLPCISGSSFSTPRHWNDTPCAKPVAIKTGMNGNGHAETWDGRVFVITKNTQEPPHTVGWLVRVFRPERLRKTANGVLDFSDQAFSDELVLELDTETVSHNALAIVPAPEFSENPFRSDAAGVAQPRGAFLTYEILIYSQNYEQDNKLQARRARIVLQEPYTADASVASATLLNDFTLVTTKSGNHLRAIEPSISIDGRLLIAQGHPDNDGKIDYLVYSYNEQPGALDGWTDFRFISDMHTEKDTLVDGLPFGARFPIAQQPLRDASGVLYEPNEPFHGAYPWISHDGTELFYMATVAGDNDARPGERARRGGASVIGRLTNWAARHIDGPINPSREGLTPESTVRLFFSSPGGFTTMWSPFPEVENRLMPYAGRGPAYPLFGSNTGDYNEVSFEDFLDRNYILALRMNELVDHEGRIDPTRTADTSGNFNTGVLEGALFPLEVDGTDESVGVVGQGLYFPADGGVRVSHSVSFERLADGLTAELYVKRAVDLDQDDADRSIDLLHKPGSFRLRLLDSGRLDAEIVVNGSSLSTGPFGDPLPVGSWVHVAFSYDGSSGELRGYLDGALSQAVSGDPGPVDVGDADLLIGPAGQSDAPPFVSGDTPLVLLDELLISDLVRSDREIAASAYRCEAPPASGKLADLPLGLRASELRVPTNSVNTEAARALGLQLFFEPRLSREESMACASCHQPDRGFTDGLPTGLGNGKFLSRNTPTLFNRAFGTAQFWDGRVGSLESLIRVPIENPDEMDLPFGEAVARLQGIPGYVEQFQTVFGKDPDADGLEKALAAFQRSLLAGNSAVDRYEAGELDALTESERRGRLLFRGKARCLGCHGGGNYTDESFHNTGLVCVGDEGLAAVTDRARDLGLFKTPTLRNVAQTAPYMHDGSLGTLEEVVAAYNRGGDHRVNVDVEIYPLGLNEQEQEDLVAFLKALTSEPFPIVAPSLP